MSIRRGPRRCATPGASAPAPSYRGVTFVNGRVSDVCIWWTHNRQLVARFIQIAALYTGASRRQRAGTGGTGWPRRCGRERGKSVIAAPKSGCVRDSFLPRTGPLGYDIFCVPGCRGISLLIKRPDICDPLPKVSSKAKIARYLEIP